MRMIYGSYTRGNEIKRRFSRFISVFGGFFAVLLFVNAGMGAFSQESYLPIIETKEALNIQQTSAVLSGVVNPNGYPTTYYYEYGESASLGSRTPIQTAGASNSSVPVPVPVSVYDLHATTQYSFRLVAQNQFGAVRTAIRHFATPGPELSYANFPSVTTNAASDVYGTMATIRGYTEATNGEGQAWFEYGTDPDSLLTATPPTDILPVEYYRTTNVSPFFTARLTNLVPGTTYYFRAALRRNSRTGYGALMSFRTPGGVPAPDYTNPAYSYSAPSYAYTPAYSYSLPTPSSPSYTYAVPSYASYASTYSYPSSPSYDSGGSPYGYSYYTPSPSYASAYPTYASNNYTYPSSYYSSYQYPQYASTYSSDVSSAYYSYQYPNQNYQYAAYSYQSAPVYTYSYPAATGGYQAKVAYESPVETSVNTVAAKPAVSKTVTTYKTANTAPVAQSADVTLTPCACASNPSTYQTTQYQTAQYQTPQPYQNLTASISSPPKAVSASAMLFGFILLCIALVLFGWFLWGRRTA